MSAPGPGSPLTGLRQWGGGPDFRTWDSTNPNQQALNERNFPSDANPETTADLPSRTVILRRKATKDLRLFLRIQMQR
jgi:hypothetical protein